ncbi:MAG: sodium:solute symporter family protein [Methanosarcinaceae archaeon]|nr:sodium:solute symporter family protein [Methanosarcinaceae archaeon]
MTVDLKLLIAITTVYLLITFGLGWYGYKKTKTDADYMLAGRNASAVVMALSYGATFISTSAIIGFGGMAAKTGMGLLWLAFLNILVGIIIAFLVLGPKMRAMGKKLHASTFPEFLGNRFKSSKMQSLVGLMLTFTMPLYAASVLIASANYIQTIFGIPYTTALLIFAAIVAIYVIVGGILSVMYTDAFQAVIMFAGMALLLVFTYSKMGGVIEAHTTLTNFAYYVPQDLVDAGHLGWTAMPAFNSEIWWMIVSSLILGVGIGIIAQPQLAVRFMMVKDNKTLKRSVLAGGPFIFMMAGVAYIVGSLSNNYFITEYNMTAFDYVGKDVDLIIPQFINEFMPESFILIFTLALISAAMSTAGSQFHTMGTSFGYDVIQNGMFKGRSKKSAIVFTRIGIIITILIALVLAYILPGNIIARSTSMFMGMCTSAFLPAYVGGLFWKKMTKEGAYASIIVGFVTSIFWYVFVHASEAVPLGICEFLTGSPTLLSGTWALVDPILIATPLSIIVAIAVSLMTKPMPKDFIKSIF